MQTERVCNPKLPKTLLGNATAEPQAKRDGGRHDAAWRWVKGAGMRTSDVRSGAWSERAAQDLRRSAQSFVRDPVFTGMALPTLGLGIGASTAVFTLISSSALRLLPVEELSRLARLYLGAQTGE